MNRNFFQASKRPSRLLAAIRSKRRICVYGDYDVDGVTGTAILLTCLTLLGGNVEFHVPHRLEQGYGLSSETLRTLAERGVQVVVTVDCGIASLAEAEEAHRLGLELLITDHHEPKSELPRAAVVVHPRLPGAAALSLWRPCAARRSPSSWRGRCARSIAVGQK